MTAVGAEPRGAPPADALERRTRAIGRELFEAVGGRARPWQRAWWDDRLMGITMGDAGTKVQLFRFIDALPTLTDDASARRHLAEYLDEAGAGVPAFVGLPLRLAPRGPLGDRIIAGLARFGATVMARRFIAGSTPAEAFRTIHKLRGRGLGFTADLLGEAIISDSEAAAYQQTCLDLLEGLAGPLASQPEDPRIDRDDHGPIPRCNLSLKLTSLTPRFDPLHAETTTERVLERLRPILRKSRELGAFVNVDMEQFAYKDLTYAIFRRVMTETEFRDWSDIGIVCQAYLRDSLADLERLRDWAEERGTPITVRLVKGAYWDYEVTIARQVGWPVPVYQEKWATDANYEACSRLLMNSHEVLRPALGSHNVRSLAHGLAAAEEYGVPRGAYEIQMLYGMGESFQNALVDRGLRVRVYTPYGAMLPGMAYLVRRLLENTSNESFLLASSSGAVPVEELIRNPEEVGAMFGRKRASERDAAAVGDGARELPPFRNEPPTDFDREENRDTMRAALDEVRSKLGIDIPLVIGGRRVVTDERLESRDPGDRSRLVARTSKATAEHADGALRAARAAAPGWAATPARERADVLIRAADAMRRRKFELMAWEVFECAKPWREADGDLAEAIDFCEFYAREMVRLDEPDPRDVPGETNALEYLPRGVGVVIPPWNFPLAIPCGMVVASLVAGNATILKPAEQSPAMGWFLVEALKEAGLPDGVLGFLPGVGEEVGAALVADPRVNLIAFTGSRAVGLHINAQAAETPKGQGHVKRVIAEMGGKNAIIIDDDADLDEAVVGVLQSAFGYAGQKCSACSRVIVLAGVYDAFVARLAEAAKSITVGPAEDPDTVVPPVIDDEARDRILEAQAAAVRDGRVVARIDAGGLASKGSYVSPLIVADVRPDAPVAQEEIFGPVLAILKARDLDHALEIANGTAYALTGGLYSRSPANITRVKRELAAGNVYINRTITGAVVNRQPFGGYRLSGIGTKAGGPDYLREFLLPRTVTENTLRRGFAPEPEARPDRAVAASSGT